MRFHGRGYVQIIGRFNYTQFGTTLGIDLAGDPDLAVQPAPCLPHRVARDA